MEKKMGEILKIEGPGGASLQNTPASGLAPVKILIEVLPKG